MIETDPEKRLKQIESLEACPGWTFWLVPTLKERQEAIKDELLGDLSEADTTRLRNEFRWIKSVLTRPETAKVGLLRKPTPPPAGNGKI